MFWWINEYDWKRRDKKIFIRNEELSVAVEKLIDLSVERGGIDNISVAILNNLRGDSNDRQNDM